MRLGGAFLLGLGVTAAALAFGSRPLGVAGVGLLLAASLARIWAGFVRGGVSVSYVAAPSPAVEGDRVRLRVEALRLSGVPVGSIVAYGRLGRLGPFELPLRGHGRRAKADLFLGRPARGRFVLSDTRLVLGDHLGLESVAVPVDAGEVAVVVHPRLVEIETLFSDAGRIGGHGRRLLLRRPAGFDLHSVREYTQGESLRRVHWPTTARTGQLMVKELEDSPRDTVSVLLDCDPATVSGQPPDSSFDAAVRAAGSVLRHYATRARRATLVTTGRAAVVQPVTTAESDFRVALDLLAAAEPDALFALAPWLRQEPARGMQAGELVVVTSNLDPAALEAILAAATRRLVAVVWVDAPSFAGKPSRAATGPLRLSAAGIPVAAVRRDEDLASALDFSGAAVVPAHA
jgi:uncharacterized protein (DUF58 family)